MNLTNLTKNTGNVFKSLRIEKGYTQKDIAKIVNITVSYYGKIERGEVDASIYTIARITQAFNITLEELYKLVEK